MKRLKYFAAVMLAVMLSSTTGCASTFDQETTADSVITTRVKVAVLDTDSLKFGDITVATFRGEVQLSGYANSQADANRAIEVALSVEGVTLVKNEIRITGHQ